MDEYNSLMRIEILDQEIKALIESTQFILDKLTAMSDSPILKQGYPDKYVSKSTLSPHIRKESFERHNGSRLFEHLNAIRDIKNEYDLSLHGISPSSSSKINRIIDNMGQTDALEINVSFQTIFKLYDAWIELAPIKKTISRRVYPYKDKIKLSLPETRVQRAEAFLALAEWIRGNKK